MTRLIVLDRDGVINQDSDAFVKNAAEFIPLPGALAAIARLHRAGLPVAVCTNQSGIGRGLLDEPALAEIHAKLEQLAVAAGGRIDAIRYCPHLPDSGCSCRKPSPGMVLDLMNCFSARPEETVFVGDSLRDLEAGRAAGCRVVLVRTGNGSHAAGKAEKAGFTEVYDDLAGFVDAELARIQGPGGVQH